MTTPTSFFATLGATALIASTSIANAQDYTVAWKGARRFQVPTVISK